MSYTYTALIQYRDSDGRFANLTQSPTVTAYDTAGNSISDPAIANITTGLYKVSVTQADLEDVVFRVVPHADDQAAFEDVAVMQEKVYHVADEILTDTGTTIPGTITTIDGIVDSILEDTRTTIPGSMALEATLTAIKGAGWSDETLVAIQAAVEAIVGGATAQQVWEYAQRYLSGQTDGLMVIGPVRNDGKIDAIAGDDYYTSDGRGMQWSDTAWPDLEGATVNFISGSTTIAMTVVTSGSGEQTINLDVPKATSSSMKGEFNFKIKAILASTHEVTLLEGTGRFR